jgi:hypothetical protein
MSRIPLENVLQGVVPDCVCRATMCAVGSRLRVGVFVLLAALLIVPPLLAQRVAGRVADSLSGRGLPGARVTLSRDSVAVLTRAADDSGRFDLKAPQPVRYTLRVIAIGYAPYSTPVDGTRDTQLGVIRLVRLPMTLDSVVSRANPGSVFQVTLGRTVFQRHAAIFLESGYPTTSHL